MDEYPKEPWRDSMTIGWLHGSGVHLLGICSDPTNINVAWVTGSLKSADELRDRICAAVNFTAGFPTSALNGSSLGEVVAELEAALKVTKLAFAFACWEANDPRSDECCPVDSLLEAAREFNSRPGRALLARLQPTKPA